MYNYHSNCCSVAVRITYTGQDTWLKIKNCTDLFGYCILLVNMEMPKFQLLIIPISFPRHFEFSIMWLARYDPIHSNINYSTAVASTEHNAQINILTRIVGGQWRHEFAINGYKLTVHVHIWWFCDVTGRLLFVCGY